MKKHEFRSRVDDRLSSLTWDTGMQQRVLRLIDQKEEKNVRHMKKGTLALVLALILMIATMTVGFAIGDFFGILQYAPEKAGNQAYLDMILVVGQTYDLGAFSVTVNEAAFDGMRLLTTMELSSKDGVDPVFVLPKVRAKINGEAVETRWEGGRGFYTEAGFWAPYVSGKANVESYPEYGGAEIALWHTSEEDGRGNYRIADDTVEWEIVFDAYKPMMSLAFTDSDEPAMDEEPWTDEEYEAHRQYLARAYEEGKILLNAYTDPWWYLSCIPQKDGIDGGEKSQEEVWENAVEMGVFKLEQEAVFRFETASPPVWSLTKKPTLSLPDGFIATVEKLDVSVDWASLRMKITREDGTPAAPYCSTFDWEFVLLAPGAKTNVQASELGSVEDGSLRCDCRVELSGPADQVIIVPCHVSEKAVGGDGNLHPLPYATYQRQELITEEQKRLMLTIDLK